MTISNQDRCVIPDKDASSLYHSRLRDLVAKNTSKGIEVTESFVIANNYIDEAGD